ncbi:co-chaperone YbbN [Corynebacterium diphtheriae]|nr:co-chaperone YbbN [Corynebacterium diphtheriae]
MTTPNRFVAGAIDLGEVKARAEARSQAQRAGQSSVAEVEPTVTITMDNVEEQLIKRSMQVPAVVLIGTPRSPDSEQLRADLSQIASGASLSFIFAYIDADATPQVAQMFGIQGLPTVVALAQGQPLANFEGGQPMEALQQWTAAVVKAVEGKLPGITGDDAEAEPAEDPRFEPATEALNAGDFDAAIAVYEEILRHEPKNQMALQARDNARLLSRLKDADGSVDPIAVADADLQDVDKAFAAADAEITTGKVEEAFDRLIELLPNEKVRTRLLELYSVFEPSDSRVQAARSKMASKLF